MVGATLVIVVTNAFVACNRTDEKSAKLSRRVANYLIKFGQVSTNLKYSLGFEEREK
jgi:hypothetical protein